MERIVIIGASGFGKEVKMILNAINDKSKEWDFKGFYDDGIEQGTAIIEGFNCLGTIDNLVENTKQATSVVFGIADRDVVIKIQNKLIKSKHFNFPNIIHPSVEITSGVKFGKGNVMAFGSAISCDVSIGDFNFFNSFVALGHDAVIENFNCFMPRVQVSGGVVIKEFNFFGMNSSIVQNKTIGNRNVINAYTLLTKSIGNDRKYFGIPGRKINI